MFYVIEIDYNKRNCFEFDYKDPTPYIGLNKSAEIKRGDYKSDEILHLIRDKGKEFDPILKGAMSPLISNEVKNIFEETGLKGWKSTPVKLEIKRGQINEDYHRFFITGKVGPILYDDLPVLEKTVDLGYKTYRKKYKLGLKLDIATWDGSDFFMSIDTSGYIIATDKAREVLEWTKSDNLIITPIKEMEVSADNKTQKIES